MSRITGASLRESGSTEYFAIFVSAGGAAKPLSGVEVRLPKAASSKKDGLVILSIDTAARITPESIEQRFGPRGDMDVPEPAAPYEFAFTYKQPWGELSFAFARQTRYLMSVALNAIESPAAEVKRWLDTFAAYPGARELCSQHVTGNLMHILWTAYAASDAPEKVKAFYLQAEGKERAEQDQDSLTFRHGDKILSIHPSPAKDYPRCGTPPSPQDKTVLIVSQAVRGK